MRHLSPVSGESPVQKWPRPKLERHETLELGCQLGELATVFIFRAVPALAAGILSLDFAILSP
jgi:hypothetical protein